MIGFCVKGFSFLVALIAIGIGLATVASSKTKVDVFPDYPNQPHAPAPSFLTLEQIEVYHREGYLLLKNFTPTSSAATNSDSADHYQYQYHTQALVQAGQTVYHSFSLMDFLFGKIYSKLSFNEWRFQPAFASLAFESALPAISAQLLGLGKNDNDESSTIRVLKDAVFGQVPTSIGCGWHVDDVSFWPADTNGVTAWLALSSMSPSAGGGGIRIAPRSHRLDAKDKDTAFFQECRHAIAENAPKTTCILHDIHPTCHQRLMDMSVMFDMEPGDVLLWDRNLFHKTEPIKAETSNGDADAEQPKLRYTIRYIPNGAKVRPGAVGVHPSHQVGDTFGGPYYPQVWPKALASEVETIRQGLEADFNPLRTIGRIMLGKFKQRLFGDQDGTIKKD